MVPLVRGHGVPQCGAVVQSRGLGLHVSRPPGAEDDVVKLVAEEDLYMIISRPEAQRHHADAAGVSSPSSMMCLSPGDVGLSHGRTRAAASATVFFDLCAARLLVVPPDSRHWSLVRVERQGCV